VIDGGSSDKTVEIAKKFGAKISITDNPLIFHINKQKGVDLASGDWIFQLDADEIVTPDLLREIKEKIKTTEFQAYYLKRRNFFLKTWLKKGGQYPDPVIRLFQKGVGKFPCKSVHEQIAITGRVGLLEHDLLHYTAKTFSRYLLNSNRYTSLTAHEFQKENVGLSFPARIHFIFVKPLFTFLKLYIRHKGFLDGFPGFVFAFFSGLHIFTSYIKYYEFQKRDGNL
jgi:glycosyltransferase involved in cell wall biosynthesis